MRRKNNTPFFIIGCARSGTSLLLLLLDAHPQIAIPLESHIFTRFYPLLPMYGPLGIDKNFRKLARDILNDAWIREWQICVSCDDFCRGVREKSFSGCVDRLFTLFAEREGKSRWGDKTPSHVYYIKEIKKTFPDAQFIYLIRDGRDTAKSLKNIWFAPFNIYDIGMLWNNHVAAFQQAKAYLPESDYIEVFYESLVRDTENELARIFRFLGEEPVESGGQVPASIRLNYFNKKYSSNALLYQSITDRQIGSFRSELTQREIELFETIAGRQLQSYGYKLETPACAKLTPREKITVVGTRFYSKYRRLGFKIYLKGELQRKMRILRLFLFKFLTKAKAFK